jgi:hypothetical protein
MIKIPDFAAIFMTLADLRYRDGFDDFAVPCHNHVGEKPCGHVERFSAELRKMVLTRWDMLSPSAVAHMEAARGYSRAPHNTAAIAKYQAELGFEGKVITSGAISFTMRIPSVSEYIDASQVFLADIENEIRADNQRGRVEHVGIRAIRAYLPWIANIETVLPNKAVARTSDAQAIVRALERANADEPEAFEKKLLTYINDVQLTYVGYPVTKCPACGQTGDTPSGLYTVDPFSAFFTAAHKYTTKRRSAM